ncbi:MAG TPA: alpha/beta hydrolase [Planctomycetes bacterium]|nr:alpha/beta hydrolase [Planctomycetota bacterium]
MRHTPAALLLLALALPALPALAQDAAPTPAPSQELDLSGSWQGALSIGGTKLRLVFHFEREGEGYSAKIDSVDQGAKGIPVSGVTLTGRKLVVEVAAVAGRYEGTLDAAGRELEGTWTQAGTALPLKLTKSKAEDLPALRRPQTPKAPFPYGLEEVSIRHGGGELSPVGSITLAGTLTRPKGEGPHPAVVLVTGSGPQDRDETLLGHKPFAVIADYLTRRGFAVLRYDDRGVAKSTGDFASATSFDLAQDAEASWRFLRQQKGIDPARCGILGHSEGGLIAPLVAARQPEVSFVVLLAGPAVDGRAILELQTQKIAAAAGADPARVARDAELSSQLYDVLLGEGELDARRAKAEQILVEYIQTLPKAELGGADAATIAQRRVASLTSPWFMAFLRHDPGPTLRQLKCPVLALNGELDLQVDPGQNLPVMARELEAGGNPDYTLIKLPKHNHLFQRCQTGAIGEYSRIEETCSPLTLRTLAEWLRRRFLERE